MQVYRAPSLEMVRGEISSTSSAGGCVDEGHNEDMWMLFSCLLPLLLHVLMTQPDESCTYGPSKAAKTA